jgi:glycosyltransferase involved in cell wall biosynthesis
MHKLELSILIPTFNRSDDLENNLNVLCDQIGRGLLENCVEIIISDNLSTDSTEKICRNYVQKYPFVHYQKNSDNLGIDGNVVVAIEKAQGDYLWLLGDDDQVVPSGISYLLKQIELAKSKSLGLIILNYDVYDKHLKVKLHGPVSRFQQIYSKDSILFVKNFSHLLTFLSIVVIDRKKTLHILNQSKKYLGSLHLHYFIAAHLALNCGYFFISKPLIKFRSGCSNLGAPFWVSLVPYKILYDVGHSLQLGRRELKIALKNAFYHHVYPWLFLAKLSNRLKFTYLTECYSSYFLVFGFWTRALPLYLIPQFCVDFARFCRRFVRKI